MAILFANNATSTLAGAISNTATSCSLAGGTGVLFPSPTGGDYFVLTFTDASTGLLTEITHCTGRAGDVMTIVRAQEGTVARNWSSADLADNLITAGTFAGIAYLDSPAFTGTPASTTPASNDNSTRIATTAFVNSVLASYAPLANPAFTGNPTATTQVSGDNSTRIATTAFVKGLAYATLASPALTGTPTAPTVATGDNSTSIATTAWVRNQGFATTTYVNSQGFATTTYVNSQGFITSAALGPYATTTYVNSQGFITSAALGPYITTSAVNSLLFTNPASGWVNVNGWVVQWGSFTGVIGGSGTHTFNVAFPNGVSTLVVSPGGTSTSNTTLTAGAIDVNGFSWNWAGSGGTSFNCSYLAMGN